MTEIKKVPVKTKKDVLNALFLKYGLSLTDDIFNHKNMYKIITRSGIEKIQNKLGILVDYECVDLKMFKIPGDIVIVLKTMGRIMYDGKVLRSVVTYGEANDANLKVKSYPFAMAEKRGLSRAVLKLAGLYEHGVFSEDEADDFGDTVKRGKANLSNKARVKTEQHEIPASVPNR